MIIIGKVLVINYTQILVKKKKENSFCQNTELQLF